MRKNVWVVKGGPVLRGCAGRGKARIGDKVSESMKMLQENFENDIPWMGSFTFGEISPVKEENHFHNYSGTLAVFY